MRIIDDVDELDLEDRKSSISIDSLNSEGDDDSPIQTAAENIVKVKESGDEAVNEIAREFDEDIEEFRTSQKE